ncbi:alpha/beta fold hydrolase [Naasia lichenicola]|uniref:Alpha/beta hydrolase n=1 Tax=Naasia lichenicola TaxID=2565933 RepID=A0A4V3WTF8_9MICO|nr:alpha/beta hydrolase [Naasia lichenicola]THG31787.1 alpha/beta hydrolase [Naasia lichenicola]
MNIVLVPGFWLDGSSWDEVARPIRLAGHEVIALTPPGRDSLGADRAGIGIADHVAAVVDAIDGIDGHVVLVGHSGGGPTIYGAVDARPQRVVRTIYVDSFPLPDGFPINDSLPAVGDSIPLPPWDFFQEADLVDLDEDLRESFRARAIPEARRVAYDRQSLSDESRRHVPATVITCEFPIAQIEAFIAQEVPMVAELAALKDVEYVELPTGHWPQFTKPEELAEAILAALR